MTQVIVRTVALLFFIIQAAPAAPVEDRPATDKERARITAALEKRGYKNIHDVEVDDGRFEADATSPAGYEVELELDMKSLKIVASIATNLKKLKVWLTALSSLPKRRMNA